MRIVFLLFISLLLSIVGQAQMWNGQDTIYGNEWISNQSNPIFKFGVDTDGVYRLSYEVLKSSGFPVDNINGKNYRLYKNGEEVHIYVSRDGVLSNNDFIEFFGVGNKDDLDQFLVKDANTQLLNPLKSLYGNTAYYFLTWSDSESDKRIETIENDLENVSAPEPYFFAKVNRNYTNSLVKNQGLQGGVFWSNYEESEGYCQGFKSTYTEDLAVSRVYVDQPIDASLEIRIGFDHRTIQSHNYTFNDNILLDTSMNGSEVRTFKFNIPNEQIVAGNEFAINLNEGNTGRFTLSNLEFKYARRFDFANRPIFYFDLAASNDKRYFEVARFRENENDKNLLIDYKNNFRLYVLQDGNTTKFALPPVADEGELVLLDEETEIKQIESLEEIKKIDYTILDNEYIIISNERLYNDTLNGNTNWVAEYANYRSSAAGGQFGVTILNVNDLYNHFGYGLDNHPMAIRNFAHWAKKNWNNIKYVNIIGKGIEYSINNNNLNFVPTWGTNGADNLLFASHDSNVPMFAVGRVPAKTPNDIRIYLEKVIQFEDRNLEQTIEDKAWRKRFVHLSGGSDASEQASIASYLDLMATNITNSTLGANVESFYKTSQDAVDESQAERLTNIINEGTAYITFFGHSSSQTFDYSINSPEEFDNEGKYFVMNAMGCNAGKIHTGATTLSERFVFAEKKGAIAFLASSGLGYISAYRLYGNDQYKELGIDQVGKPIGDIVLHNLNTLDRGSSSGNKLLAQQMTLNGDPALRISYEEGPDYVIDEASVNFEPQLLNVELESYKINFDVVNLGYSNIDSLNIKVAIEYADGVTEDIITKLYKSPRNRESYTFELPAFTRKISGFTKFYITVDVDNNIDEYPQPVAENNNELISANGSRGIEIFLFAKETTPIFPIEFGISNDVNLELKASTSDPFQEDQITVFEIDTVETFNSSFKQRHETSQRGGLVSWNPEINFEDERVYYWRVSPDSTDNVGYAWKSSSFVFLENETGIWNQSHYYQYLKNDLSNIELDRSEIFSFKESINDISLLNKRFAGTFPPSISVNGGFLDNYRTGTVNAGIGFTVFDPITGEVWPVTPGGLYDSYGLPNARIFYFAYKTDSQVERAKAINFLNNVVPENAVVAVTTFHSNNNSYKPEEWAADSLFSGTNLYKVLEEQGAMQIRDLETEGKKPYLFVYRKGRGSMGEVKGELENSIINLDVSFPVTRSEGSMQSVEVGPATKWEQLTWEVENAETLDEYEVQIFGKRSNDNFDELILSSDSDIDLTGIDASIYEKLRIDFIARDTGAMRSAVDLKNWRVLYEEIPELALNPNASFSFRSDTLQQGDSVRVSLAVDNISNTGMDSVLIAYTLRFPDNTERIETQRIQPIAAGEQVILEFKTAVGINFGSHSLIVDVNPNDDQREKFHFNNVGVYNFYVEGDERNPILDVTFDGAHIINGDLVSSDPLIKIELNDENKFLALVDTSLMEVGLIYPGTNNPIFQSYNDGKLIFYPASTDNLDRENKAVIDFFPGKLEDGIYTLVVLARDQSGNISGPEAYRISFEVVSTKSISNVVNYPNPFSTSTRFVYTMTGDESPDQFKIQIMTVSGKVVREITKMDLGELRIGTHMTDYAWDGTDEYGDKLAAGVYLYKVIAKNANGEDYEKRDVGTDNFFERGIGKLVIMR